jgi:NAD(P)-dependent dehydrogenase (short-subunit alcohol dehydrogenase family)
MKFTISETIPRTALITGGVLQLALVAALTDAGFAVALQCQPGAEVDVPDGVLALPADLSDEAQTAALLQRADAALGTIGVLVNAVSTLESDTWDDATRATWDMHMETNLRAPFVLTQHFARALPAPHEGVVINLLDQRVCPRLLSYTLSKAALWSLTQTMALALAPRIRVNGINAGPEPKTGDEIGRAALAILAFASMTGQMIVPEGAHPPPPAG